MLRLSHNDRMTRSADGADLALFAGDEIATPEAPFSNVAVLPDTPQTFWTGASTTTDRGRLA
jgi:hypothetical protein